MKVNSSIKSENKVLAIANEIRAKRNEAVPDRYQPVQTLAEEVEVTAHDQLERPIVTIAGTPVQVNYGKGVERNKEHYTLKECKLSKEMEVNGTKYPAGLPSLRLY